MTDTGHLEAAALVERRVETALEVARRHRTGVALDDLSAILPDSGPGSAFEWGDWFDAHPRAGSVVLDRAVPPGGSPWLASTLERRARGERYWAETARLLEGPLRHGLPLLRYLGVTGSTAYGEPESGDDCDFMAVVRTGGVWTFLAFAFLTLRLARPRMKADGPAAWCFNWVLDETSALREYARPRGFLFAREALMSRPVRGEEYYRNLLRSAPWLEMEAPRLFARWGSPSGPAESPTPRPVSRGLRVLNAVLFPWIATYLQLVGLYRNHRFAAVGERERGFRTITRLSRYALVTEKYERLERMYAQSSALPN
jgi:hypothetical protein